MAGSETPSFLGLVWHQIPHHLDSSLPSILRSLSAFLAMSLNLCSVCRVIFDGPLVLGEERPHHQTPNDFLKAATTCYICRTIIKSDLWSELERRVRLNENVPPATWFLAPQGCQDKIGDTASTWYKLTIDHDWGERDGELYPPSNAGSDDLPDFYPDTPIWEFRIRPSKGAPCPF